MAALRLAKVTQRGQRITLTADRPAALDATLARAKALFGDRDRLEADRGGVTITRLRLDIYPNGTPRRFPPGLASRHEFIVTNAGPAPRTLEAVALHGSPAFRLAAGAALPYALAPGESAAVAVEAQPTCAGAHRTVAAFRFPGFAVCRLLELRCGDSDLADLLRPTAPYTRPAPRRPRMPGADEPVDGEKPPGGGSPAAIPACGLDPRCPRWIVTSGLSPIYFLLMFPLYD
jgi:hypothetical protein